MAELAARQRAGTVSDARVQAPMPAIQLDHVSKWFFKNGKRFTAVDDVSTDIPQGAFITLVGPSGCGKTTIFNMIAGFAQPDRGSVVCNGRAVTAPNIGIGYMTQKDALLPWRSVAENVALGLKFAGTGRKERRERALELLRLVGLQDFADAAPYELSGGMRQRVGIARALAPDPAILLMDEPFGALDSMTREQMQELLVDVWSRTGKQIFFITHSIEEALFLGTQVIVMSPRPGRIVKRYDLEFVSAFARDRDARAIKTAPQFAALREEIRAVVHQSEPTRSSVS